MEDCPTGKEGEVAGVAVKESTNILRAQSVYAILGRTFLRIKIAQFATMLSVIGHNVVLRFMGSLILYLSHLSSQTQLPDHKIINENDSSRESDRVALLVLDRYSRWLQAYASKQQIASECEKFFKRFVGPQCKPEHVFTDKAQEFRNSLRGTASRHIYSSSIRNQWCDRAVCSNS